VGYLVALLQDPSHLVPSIIIVFAPIDDTRANIIFPMLPEKVTNNNKHSSVTKKTHTHTLSSINSVPRGVWQAHPNRGNG